MLSICDQASQVTTAPSAECHRAIKLSSRLTYQSLNFSDQSYTLLDTRTFLRHDAYPGAEEIAEMGSKPWNVMFEESWSKGGVLEGDEDDEHRACHSGGCQSDAALPYDACTEQKHRRTKLTIMHKSTYQS